MQLFITVSYYSNLIDSFKQSDNKKKHISVPSWRHREWGLGDLRLFSLALTLLSGTASCRCVGSTTRRCGPSSSRSSRWSRRTCILLSKRSPSSTARRTNLLRPRSSTWTSRTWRVYHWTPHPIPNARRTSVETTVPRWAYGAITRSTCPIRIWTVERKMAEFGLYPDLVHPNICFGVFSVFF